MYNIDVDDLINNISDIIVSAGDMTLKRKSFGVKKKKPRKIYKRWYDRDCYIFLKSAKNAFNRNLNIHSLLLENWKNIKGSQNLRGENTKKILTIMLNDAMDKDPLTAWKITDEMNRDTVQTDKSEKK